MGVGAISYGIFEHLLRTELRHNSILSEIELYQGASPTEPVHRTGETAIKASTFDWYVPIVSPWGAYADDLKYADFATVAGVGGSKMAMFAKAASQSI